MSSRAENLWKPSQFVKPLQPIKNGLVHILRVLLSVASWNVATSFPLTTGRLWLVYSVYLF